MNEQSSVIQRLEKLETIGIKLGLDQIRLLLSFLGNPQDSYPSILIAGTNGKGSVSAMLEAILRLHGYRTGHYTSPHLTSIRERIRLKGEMIPEDEFVQFLSLVFKCIDQLLELSQLEAIPTYFETITATGFLAFQRKKVEIAVAEVGLGGRFDATNVLQQSISVITSIDLDHEEFLGKSLPEIAFEKAGIFKPGAPVIAGLTSREALDVLRSTAHEKKCLFFHTDLSNLDGLSLDNGFPTFIYTPWNTRVRVNLRGSHQAWNAVTALKTCDQLRKLGFELQNEIICKALNTVTWPGRLDVISQDPLTIVDCAHNPMGVRSLARFLEDMGWNRVVALFTAMRDKKILPMLHAISDKIETIYLTRVPPYNRCATLELLTDSARNAGVRFESEEDTREALMRASKAARQAGRPLVIFGSIYLIGEILKATTEERG